MDFIKYGIIITITGFLVSCNQEQQQVQHANSSPGKKDNAKEIAFEALPAETEVEMQHILSNYLELKDALIRTQFDEAREIANVMNNNVCHVHCEIDNERKSYFHPRMEEIRASAMKIEYAENIGEQRQYFEQMSKNLYELVNAFGFHDKTLYYQYCPEALNGEGAMWISDKEEIENPYFDPENQKCGSVQEVIRG